jgi:hypothetical protein
VSVGWGIDVPGLMTWHEIAEMCVRRGVVAVLLADEHMTAAIDGPGMVTFVPAATVGGDVLYRAQVVDWAEL